jgi:hypothetical protein
MMRNCKENNPKKKSTKIILDIITYPNKDIQVTSTILSHLGLNRSTHCGLLNSKQYDNQYYNIMVRNHKEKNNKRR